MPPKGRKRKPKKPKKNRGRYPKKPKKNKGKRNPQKVKLRILRFEIKHRLRNVQDAIIRARVQPEIDKAPWRGQKIDKKNLDCTISKKVLYENGVCIQTASKLRNHPIRLIDAQEADFAAKLEKQELSEEAEDLSSLYPIRDIQIYQGVCPQEVRSSLKRQTSYTAGSASNQTAQEDHDNYEVYDDYEKWVKQEDNEYKDKSSKPTEEAQSDYTYTTDAESEDEYTYEYLTSEENDPEEVESESEETIRRFDRLPKPATSSHNVSLSPDSEQSVTEPAARKKVKSQKLAKQTSTASGVTGAVKVKEPEEEGPKVKIEVNEEPKTSVLSDVDTIDSTPNLPNIRRRREKLVNDQEVDDHLRDEYIKSGIERNQRRQRQLRDQRIKSRQEEIRLARVASRCTRSGKKR